MVLWRSVQYVFMKRLPNSSLQCELPVPFHSWPYCCGEDTRDISYIVKWRLGDATGHTPTDEGFMWTQDRLFPRASCSCPARLGHARSRCSKGLITQLCIWEFSTNPQWRETVPLEVYAKRRQWRKHQNHLHAAKPIDPLTVNGARDRDGRRKLKCQILCPPTPGHYVLTLWHWLPYSQTLFFIVFWDFKTVNFHGQTNMLHFIAKLHTYG